MTVRTQGDRQQAEQTIEHYALQGTVTREAGLLLDVQTQGSAAKWIIGTSDTAGTASKVLIKGAAGSFNVEGLDRDQARRMMAAIRGFLIGLREARAAAIALPDAPQGSGAVDGTGTPDGAGTRRPSALSPAQRGQLRAIVDASSGLLSRLEAEDTLQDIHFESSRGADGDVGQVRLGLTSEAHDNRLNAALDVTINDLRLSGVPADLAAYVPRHIEIKPALSQVRIEQVMRLLRDATAPNPDQPTLQAEAYALLDDPDARIGISSLTLDAGPLQLTGSARLRPQLDGVPEVDVHLVATGLDALVAQAERNPGVQQLLPMVFLVKGIARQEGDGLAWDISLGDGRVTVNGVPLGGTGRSPLGQSPSGRPAPAGR